MNIKKWGMTMFRDISIYRRFKFCVVFPLFLIFNLCSVVSNAYTVVFVHLGEKLPLYIHDSLMQARLFNDDAAICLIANNQALSLEEVKFAEKFKIKLISCESLT